MVLQESNHSKVNDKKKPEQKRHQSRKGLVGRKVRETVR